MAHGWGTRDKANILDDRFFWSLALALHANSMTRLFDR